MGQAASSQSSPSASSTAAPRSNRTSFWRRSTVLTSESPQTVTPPHPRVRDATRRQSSADRLSRILHQVIPSNPSGSGRRSTANTRARRSHRTSTLNPVASEIATTTRERTLQELLEANLRDVTTAARSSRPEISLPRVDVPVTQLDLDFSSTNSPAPQRPAPQRSSLRLPNTFSDRLSGFRQNRSVTTTTTNTVLRRRRAPIASSEDNAALLSRLLSVAASTTAQTLLEGSQHSMAEATGTPMEGEDGSWDSFLRSLESGPLSVALRDGSAGDGSSPLNLFRLFRFEPRQTMTVNAGQQRMVPIIIVGIRSVAPGSAQDGSDDSVVPTFLEALTTTPINTRNLFNNSRSESRRGLSSQRRRASMGGIGQLSNGFESQRHDRSLGRLRPQSVAAELASWPRPPPTTPATPASPASFASPVESFNNSRAVSPSRTPGSPGFDGGDSVISTTTTTTLETTTEGNTSPQPSLRPRTLGESEQRNSTYNARRTGIVEPDAPPPEHTRSWIIYVLGGSYPENHPLLHTPSLFTDSPTYEDMMLLQTLVAPAKPPVASDTDVASAGGIYDIRASVNEAGHSILVAVEKSGTETIEVAPEQRCLVCLCDLEKEEEARKLADCGHLFHRECIDEVSLFFPV